MKLTPTQFRVLNYRNIDDSGWIQIDRVTAFVGRNESGKTSLLKALHKFNPAVREPYDPQTEFPRDRFISEYESKAKWPVCRVEFSLSDDFREELSQRINATVPNTATLTRHYSGHLDFQYDVEIADTVQTAELITALNALIQGTRRLTAPDEERKEAVKTLKPALVNWANEKKSKAEKIPNLRTQRGIKLLEQVCAEINTHSQPESSSLVEKFGDIAKKLLDRAKADAASKLINGAAREALPIFIYFENYGIINSAVYLPRFLQDLKAKPTNPPVRTINAMFKHTKLTAQEIADLGKERAGSDGQKATPKVIQEDLRNKDLRNMQLSEASRDISRKFSQWYGQRQHNIRYHADGDYFRVWVHDDKRPNVEIELESRSKGFQWFFSFYLVFLTESDEGHKEAILLLDEPGLHLHPTAKQELLDFFDALSEKNLLLYTTHSPFLIDGKRLQRVRPITESDTGHSQISADGWPKDRETIFPLQAAAGYAMVSKLFEYKKNVLVEGLSDYLYLHSLNLHCHALERESLPEDIYITPCGGTKCVGNIASLFLGQEIRPIILLDSDEAGKARQDALLKDLYTGHEQAILMLDDVLGQEEAEIEDVIGETIVLSILSEIVGKKVTLTQRDRKKNGLVNQIKSAAEHGAVKLPDFWKSEIARRFSVAWSTKEPKECDADVLDRAEALFKELNKRFSKSKS